MNQNNPITIPDQSTYPPYTDFPGYVQSNNTFAKNKGKNVTLYMSFPNSLEWRDHVFSGKIIDANKNNIIIEDTDKRKFVIWINHINYAIFDEEISF